MNISQVHQIIINAYRSAPPAVQELVMALIKEAALTDWAVRFTKKL